MFLIRNRSIESLIKDAYFCKKLLLLLNFTQNQKIAFKGTSECIAIKREDLIHPFISGNKYRKLKYNIQRAKEEKSKVLLSFGGAFSNHIAAMAFAGKTYGFHTVGVIRGDELKDNDALNPTLEFAKAHGMQLKFISRADYKRKADPNYLQVLKEEFSDCYVIPEGGTNELAVKGCEEILNPEDHIYDYICTCVGTGGTISGIINASKGHQKILGFSALKEDFLEQDIHKFANQENWELIKDYHFGGYGKIKPELIAFINTFKRDYGIPLDPIYTGKMMFGVCDLLEKGFFPKQAKILVIHTGGIQGIAGMNLKLKQKNWPLINE